MHGDRTRYSTLLICRCGCRVQDSDPERAHRIMAAHEQAAGCSTQSREALRSAASRARRGR